MDKPEVTMFQLNDAPDFRYVWVQKKDIIGVEVDTYGDRCLLYLSSGQTLRILEPLEDVLECVWGKVVLDKWDCFISDWRSEKDDLQTDNTAGHLP